MKTHTPITSAIRNAIAIDLTPAIPAKSVPANICPASGLLYFKIWKNEAGSIGNCFCSSFSSDFWKRKFLCVAWIYYSLKHQKVQDGLWQYLKTCCKCFHAVSLINFFGKNRQNTTFHVSLFNCLAVFSNTAEKLNDILIKTPVSESLSDKKANCRSQ